MIYISQLTRNDGSTKKHNGRPSKNFLKNHPEFVIYYESGKCNEYIYRTSFKIENSVLIKVSDFEVHERSMDVY